MRGKQKPSSPKPREIDDILQLAQIEAKCTTGIECRFKANCSLKLPLAESCLWSAKKSIGSKVAFPVSQTNVEFPVGWRNWEFWSGNECRVSLVWELIWRFGVLPSIHVACEEPCRCMQGCWLPQTLPNWTRQPSRFMSTVLTPD